LLAHEDGPADIVARLRKHLGSSVVGGLIDCFGCLSIWVALPLAFFVATGPLEVVLSWLALSGAAFLLERMGPEPVVFERAPDAEGGLNDGMLRSESHDPRQAANSERADPQSR
jgi:hypothetical protein